MYIFYKSNKVNAENINLSSAMSGTSQMFYVVLLCLFCMSDNVNQDVSETVHNNIGKAIHEIHQDDRKIVRGLANLTKKVTLAMPSFLLKRVFIRGCCQCSQIYK